MRRLLTLMAAASLFTACHNRAEEEIGAAPDRGDTTTTVADTAQYVPTDTTMAQAPSPVDTSSTCNSGADTTMVGC